MTLNMGLLNGFKSLKGEPRLYSYNCYCQLKISASIYFQDNPTCLSVCTLPIHALLHIAEDIRNMGPVWCYWAFPMERFCGSLLPSIRSRKHPFSSINHRVRDIAQLNQIKLLYHLTEELDLSDHQNELVTGEQYPACEYLIGFLLPGSELIKIFFEF